MTRLDANIEILEILKYMFEQNPELRFTQMLSILKLDRDRFYEESEVTLDNICDICNNMLVKT